MELLTTLKKQKVNKLTQVHLIQNNGKQLLLAFEGDSIPKIILPIK